MSKTKASKNGIEHLLTVPNSNCILLYAITLLAMMFTEPILIRPHFRETVDSTNEAIHWWKKTIPWRPFTILFSSSPGQEVLPVLRMNSVTCSFPAAFFLGSLEMQNKLFSYFFMLQKTYFGLQRTTHLPANSRSAWPCANDSILKRFHSSAGNVRRNVLSL